MSAAIQITFDSQRGFARVQVPFVTSLKPALALLIGATFHHSRGAQVVDRKPKYPSLKRM
jgi:hypothetical protein